MLLQVKMTKAVACAMKYSPNIGYAKKRRDEGQVQLPP